LVMLLVLAMSGVSHTWPRRMVAVGTLLLFNIKKGICHQSPFALCSNGIEISLMSLI
jgi:hypothetical protein